MTAAEHSQLEASAAPFARSAAEAVVARVGFTCQTAAGGRRAVRALAAWAHRFQLTEPDFQVLWALRLPHAEGLDQSTLARQLAYSPAQVSGTVERLRAAGWIVQWPSLRDRRRHRWQLSEAGRRLLDEMLATAERLKHDIEGDAAVAADRGRKEAA